MILELRTLKTQPLRLGQCKACPYRDTGAAAICYACARRDFTTLTGEGRCERCELKLKADGTCPNIVCAWYRERAFSRNYALAARDGRIKAVGNAYKFDGRKGFAVILGRILVGHMDANADTFRAYEVILPTPANPSAPWDHTRDVVAAAAAEAGKRWPFELDRVMVRTKDVPAVKERSWKKAREIAEGPLRDSLEVKKPARVDGKRVLVYDDIFTIGFTLREEAKKLREAGAREVAGITLMREPFDPTDATAA